MTTPTPPTEIETCLTLPQTARVLGVSYRRALALTHTGELKAKRVGRLLRVTPDALRDFLQAAPTEAKQ